MTLDLNKINIDNSDSLSNDYAIRNANWIFSLDQALFNSKWKFLKFSESTKSALIRQMSWESSSSIVIKSDNIAYYYKNVNLINRLETWTKHIRNVDNIMLEWNYDLDLKQLKFYLSLKQFYYDFCFDQISDLKALNRVCWFIWMMTKRIIDEKVVPIKYWQKQFGELVIDHQTNNDINNKIGLICNNYQLIILWSKIQIYLNDKQRLQLINNLVTNEQSCHILNDYWNQDQESQLEKLITMDMQLVENLDWDLVYFYLNNSDLFKDFKRIKYKNKQWIWTNDNLKIIFRNYNHINKTIITKIFQITQLIINQIKTNDQPVFSVKEDDVDLLISGWQFFNSQYEKSVFSDRCRLKIRELLFTNLKLLKLDLKIVDNLFKDSFWLLNNLKDYYLYMILLEYNKWKKPGLKIKIKSLIRSLLSMKCDWYFLYDDLTKYDYDKIKGLNYNYRFDLEINGNCVQFKSCHYDPDFYYQAEIIEAKRQWLKNYVREEDEFKKRIEQIETLNYS